MRDLNQKLEQAIRAHLAPFITTGSPIMETPPTPTMPMSILPPEEQPQDQY